METTTLSGGGSQNAILSAMRALQDKVCRLESDRNDAVNRSSVLRSELTSRENESILAREEFAKDAGEKLEEGRREFDRLVNDKNLALVEIARGEERRKGLIKEVEVENNKADDYIDEKERTKKKTAMLAQRNLIMKREIEASAMNVKRLQIVLENERKERSARSGALQLNIEGIEESIKSECSLAIQLELKVAKSDEFLSSIMSINEALVASAHAKREANEEEERRRNIYHEHHHNFDSRDGNNRARSVPRKRILIKNQVKKPDLPPPPPPSTRRGRSQFPTHPPAVRRTNHHNESTQTNRTAKSRPPSFSSSSRPASSPASASTPTNAKITIKDRMTLANRGVIPFLPSPNIHSFNVLAAVSEAVRTDAGDVNYIIPHHRGGLSVSPPKERPRDNAIVIDVPTVASTPMTSRSYNYSSRNSSPQQPQPQQQPQQLPYELASLLSSLEDEFEELNRNYLILLSDPASRPSRINEFGGKETPENENENVEQLTNLALKMERKEKQMRMFRGLQQHDTGEGGGGSDYDDDANSNSATTRSKSVFVTQKNPIRELEMLKARQHS